MQWLFLHKFCKNNAKEAFAFLEERKELIAYKDDYDFAKLLNDQDVITLRDVIDNSEFASDTKFELTSLANEYGLILYWTPPHLGKYLNPIEIVWSIVKCRARRLRAELRKGDANLKRELSAQLAAIGKEHGILLNICLPSMRFCFAILKAVFAGTRIVHKRSKQATAKPVLFSELFECCREFGLRIGHEEVDEHAGAGAVPNDVDLEMPLGLVGAVIPQKIQTVKTLQQLQGMDSADESSQRSRVRLSAMTLLKYKQMPADVQEVLSSDTCSDHSGSDFEEADLDENAEVEVECEGLIWNGCEVKAATWIEHYGCWLLTIAGESGMEAEETVEPEDWLAHDVPAGSQHRDCEAGEVRPAKPSPKQQKSAPAPKPSQSNIEQTMSVQERHAKPGCDETQKRAAEAKQKTRHRKDASRHVENEQLLRIRSTMEKLKASRFKCTCGSKTSFHGGGDKKCGLFDRGGFQRRMGEDTGVTDAQFHEVKAFYPGRRFV